MSNNKIDGNKYAIVVGISDYTYINDLKYCDDDAVSWCDYLTLKGYTIYLFGDGTNSYGTYYLLIKTLMSFDQPNNLFEAYKRAIVDYPYDGEDTPQIAGNGELYFYTCIFLNKFIIGCLNNFINSSRFFIY